MQTAADHLVKISARIPESLLKSLSKLFPKQALSETLRNLIEQEIRKEKTLKAHLSLYGKFKPSAFDESLL